MDFIGSWGFFGLMGVLLAGLVVALVVMKKKESD